MRSHFRLVDTLHICTERLLVFERYALKFSNQSIILLETGITQHQFFLRRLLGIQIGLSSVPFRFVLLPDLLNLLCILLYTDVFSMRCPVPPLHLPFGHRRLPVMFTMFLGWCIDRHSRDDDAVNGRHLADSLLFGVVHYGVSLATSGVVVRYETVS